MIDPIKLGYPTGIGPAQDIKGPEGRPRVPANVKKLFIVRQTWDGRPYLVGDQDVVIDNPRETDVVGNFHLRRKNPTEGERGLLMAVLEEFRQNNPRNLRRGELHNFLDDSLVIRRLALSSVNHPCAEPPAPPAPPPPAPPPPPEVLFRESWNVTPAGTYIPSGDAGTFIPGDGGQWFLGDTVSSSDRCGPTPNSAVVTAGGNKHLTLNPVASHIGDCADNMFMGTDERLGFTNIPFGSEMFLSFHETGGFTGPGGPRSCARISLTLSLGGELLTYILQRGQKWDTGPPPGDPLPPCGQGGPFPLGNLILLGEQDQTYFRDLRADLVSVGLETPQLIDGIAFSISSPGSATIDEITISTARELAVVLMTDPDRVWANGHEETKLTALVTEADGQGIPGRMIRLSHDAPDGVIIEPRDDTTDANGRLSFKVRSTKTGTVTFTATGLVIPLYMSYQLPGLGK